jgi:hypothetical protein
MALSYFIGKVNKKIRRIRIRRRINNLVSVLDPDCDFGFL